MRRLAAAFVCFAVFIGPARAAASLQERLDAARDAAGTPAMGVAVIENDAVSGLAVSGLRAIDGSAKVAVGDRWHLGSNAKAMTATLIAILTERGLVSFDTPLSDIFAETVPQMQDAYRAVTVAQLLNHTSGLPANPPFFAELRSAYETRDPKGDRARVAARLLSEAPAGPAGTFIYSNSGYIVAGALAEAVTGTDFETLIKTELFTRLGMASAGFGPPGMPYIPGQPLAEPWGHMDFAGQLRSLAPSTAADNPRVYGPAGAIHMSLSDYAKFAMDHLKGARGEGALLKPETYARLHAREPGIPDYAMGWTVSGETGAIIGHGGSNSLWFALIRLDTVSGLGVILTANDARPQTVQALTGLGRALVAERDMAP